MQYAILICGDIRGYNINELSQVYVDGGIYAMNHIVSNLSGKTKDKAKEFIKSIAGENGLNKIKGILNR